MRSPRLRLVALLLALLAVFTACSGDDDDDGGESSSGSGSASVDEEEEETTTTAAPEDALAGAGELALELPSQVEEWQNGDLDDDEIRRAARQALVAAGQAREAVATLADDDPSKQLAAGAAELYFQHASLVLEAANAEGAARDETASVALDVGELATRTLEWANYVADPDAADPPQPLPGDTEAPLDRPTQPEADWHAALFGLGVPGTIDETADPAVQAGIFRDGASALGAEADPDTEDGHLTAARVRLDWLVKAAASDVARLGLTHISAPLTMVVLTEPAAAEDAA